MSHWEVVPYMRIVLDTALCSSFGMCVSLAPDLFEIGDETHVTLIMAEPPAPRYEAAEDACSACPKQALSVVE